MRQKDPENSMNIPGDGFSFSDEIKKTDYLYDSDTIQHQDMLSTYCRKQPES